MATIAFDQQFYLSQYPDVAAAISRGQFANAQDHYNQFGRFEGRDPNAFFDTSFYLSEYPDVANARVNPLDHFLAFGAQEGRFANANIESVIDADGNRVADEFDADAYLAGNPDVAAAGVDPLKHFLTFGQFEGRQASLTDGTVLTGPFGTGGTQGGQSFTLTTGVDTLTGTSSNDTFTATETGGLGGGIPFTAGDTINGGAGTDTLNIVQSTAFTVPAGVTVSNVEAVNITSASTVGINTTSGFTGLANLKTTAIGGSTVTVAATTAVNSTSTGAASGAEAISVTGGSNVTVTALNNQADTVTVSGATGAVVVNSTGTAVGGTTAGDIAVTGGSTVTVNQTAGNALNTTNTAGAVSVTGTAATTAVTVNQTAAATASATVAGAVNGNVTVLDANRASATAAGTIATVTLNNFAAAEVNSGALKTLNLSGTGTSVDADTLGALTTPAVTTLAINTNGLTTTGAVTIDNDVTTLNVASSTAASTVASLVANGATTLNVSGDAAIKFTAQTLGAVTSIVSTNTAGVTLGTTLGNNVVFTGGAGAESISLGATTKAITLGAGNDTVTLTGVLATGASVNGGDGTDTLAVSSSDQLTATTAAQISSFETLRVNDDNDGALDTFDASLLSGITSIVLGAQSSGDGVTLNNVSATQAANITIAGSQVVAPTFNVTGASNVGQLDTLSLTFDDGAATKGAFTIANLTASGVETVNLVTNEDVTVSSTTGLTSLTKLVLTGAGDANITTGALALNVNTVVDASAHTGTFTFNASAATTNGLAITGSSTAVNTITGTDQADTITGGAAGDTLNGGAGNDTINGGAGDNTLSGGAGNDTITGGAGNDTITGGAGNDIINAGAGTNIITGGAGADQVTGGAGIDTHVYTTLSDSFAAAFDTVNGFTAGTDKFDVSVVPTAIQQGTAYAATGTGDVAADVASAITAGIGSGSFAASNAAVVTISSGADAGTYLVINDTTAGFDATTDAVIKLAGLSGTLAVADFI